MKKFIIHSSLFIVLVLSLVAYAPTYKTNIGTDQGDAAGADYRMNIGADQTDAPAPAAGGQVIIITME